MESSPPRADDVTLAPDGTPAVATDLVVGTKVGRYVVATPVGSGGMGVVYLAHDPELGRRIALKVLTRTGETILREAQALARLSHPNVVTVHDVGTHGDRVWLAMELIEGTTLALWLRARARRWPEILAVLLEAGEGLAAAHAAGLVHRDVKPDNIMVAAARAGSVRVLVTDFGLAREVTPSLNVTPIRGTPAYMAPERHEARAVDGRVDQFGFCVTAWEALFGERPFDGPNVAALLVAVNRGVIRRPRRWHRVPAWLRRALERGLDADAARRWPDMATLLKELRSGRAKARRRKLATVGACLAVVTGGAAIADRVAVARARAACDDDANAIAVQWPGEAGAAREALRAALDASTVPGAEATFTRAADRLDAWTDAWRTVARAECLAHLDDRDASLHLAADACLRERRDALGSLIETLAIADPMLPRSAVQAVTGLARPQSCADEAGLLRRPIAPADGAERIAEIRRELARGRSQRQAGRLEIARRTDAAVIDAARALGWPPLLAAALVEAARAADNAADVDTAEQMLQEAFFIASEVDDPADGADAAINLVKVVGIGKSRADDALEWAAHATALIERLGESEGLRAGSLAINEATVYRSRGDFDLAIAKCEHALSIRREILGEDHPDVAAALNQLGNARVDRGDDDDEVEPLFAAALTIFESALGPDHPDVAVVNVNLGNIAYRRGRLAEARTRYERVLEIRSAAFGPHHFGTGQALMNIGVIAHSEGRFDEAVVPFAQAVDIYRASRGPAHPETVQAVANLAMALGQLGEHAKAASLLDDALEKQAAANGEDDLSYALTLRQRGRLRVLAGDARAVADLERSTALLEKLRGRDDRDTAYSVVMLGRALVKTDPQRAEASCREVLAAEVKSGLVVEGRWEAWSCLASALLEQGRDDEAATAAQRAIDIIEDAQHRSLLPEPLLLLARALWSDPTARPRARRVAQQAYDVAPSDSIRAEARAWLDAHPQ